MSRVSASGKGAAPAAPNPNSCAAAAVEALVRFSEQERLFGAAKAHESFDGILAEHALALEEVRDELGEKLGAALRWPGVRDALRQLEEQITYVRALGGVAATKEDEDAK